MKYITKLLLAIALSGSFAVSSYAVTNTEMEQARAIAAKLYLRYVNDGSGYLDNIQAASLSDLKGKLQQKELENLKAFESAKTPADYASWDKDKLAEYWSSTFFSDNASALNSKGASNGLAHKAISKQIQAMTVTAPEASQTEEVATPPSDQKLAEDLAREKEVIEEQIEQAKEQAEQNEEQPLQPIKKESSGTWVYVMILCILVGVVIALVIYAARTMKSQKAEISASSSDSDDEVRKRIDNSQALADTNRLREKFAENLAAKNEEIRGLNHKISELEEEVIGLRAEIKRLKKEKEKMLESSHQPEKFEEVAVAVEEPRVPAPKPSSEETARVIYLGKVNSKGIFVRADRRLNPGHSVYKLTTTNGLTGTYRVVNDPTLDELALESPQNWLAGGCVAKDITDTAGYSHVENVAPGTAIFEDGTWRVLRKAKIRFS